MNMNVFILHTKSKEVLLRILNDLEIDTIQFHNRLVQKSHELERLIGMASSIKGDKHTTARAIESCRMFAAEKSCVEKILKTLDIMPDQREMIRPMTKAEVRRMAPKRIRKFADEIPE